MTTDQVLSLTENAHSLAYKIKPTRSGYYTVIMGKDPYSQYKRVAYYDVDKDIWRLPLAKLCGEDIHQKFSTNQMHEVGWDYWEGY